MMKSIKNIIYLVVFIIVIGAQLLYVFIKGSELRNRIADNNETIKSTQAKIDDLNKKLEMLPSTKAELSKMEQKKTAVLNEVPIEADTTKNFVELLSITDANGFFDVGIENKEGAKYEDAVGKIESEEFKLTFTSTFEQSKKFVESLNSSYQLINISKFTVDNSVQQGGDPLLKSWFEGQINQVVKTDITFSIFARPNDGAADEYYEPIFNLFNNSDKPFENLEEQATNQNAPKEKAPDFPQQSQPEEQVVDSGGRFRLDISDVLTSGDTFKFLGPSSDPNAYTGLQSGSNTHITLTVKDDGYNIVMEDEKGKVQEHSVQTSIKNPNFTISSRMRQLEQVMPNVHIYIRNYTEQPINVELSGTLLENIHIYNEFDEEVFKGQTKGKVKLT